MNTQQLAVSPSAEMCGILAELLSFPGAELADAVRSGGLRMAVTHLAGHLAYDLRTPLHDLDTFAGPKELESEYIRLFDLPGKVPTPLYTGVYAPRRRDAMEELLRFYRFFGLTTEGGARDLPDFVPTVLEFVGFLARGIAMHREGESAAAMAAARADVLERHLAPWAGQTAARLEQRDAMPFYVAVVALVKALAEAELAQSRT